MALVANPVTTTPVITPQQTEVLSPPAPALAEQNLSREKQILEPVTIPETPARQQTQPAASEVTDFHDLPLNIRQYIPELDFSAHVYSTNPRQRSLVINGRFMEEGEQVNNDVTLVEITRDGAIFDYHGQRFRTSVISGWN